MRIPAISGIRSLIRLVFSPFIQWRVGDLQEDVLKIGFLRGQIGDGQPLGRHRIENFCDGGLGRTIAEEEPPRRRQRSGISVIRPL